MAGFQLINVQLLLCSHLVSLVVVGFVCLFVFWVVDLRQELAVRERQSDVTRMSAPSSPTQDNVKMDTAVQASLSLPATPLSKGLDNAFANQTGSCLLSATYPLIMGVQTGNILSVLY